MLKIKNSLGGNARLQRIELWLKNIINISSSIEYKICKLEREKTNLNFYKDYRYNEDIDFMIRNIKRIEIIY